MAEIVETRLDGIENARVTLTITRADDQVTVVLNGTEIGQFSGLELHAPFHQELTRRLAFGKPNVLVVTLSNFGFDPRRSNPSHLSGHLNIGGNTINLGAGSGMDNTLHGVIAQFIIVLTI